MVFDKEKCLMVNTQNGINGSNTFEIIDEESKKPTEVMYGLLFNILKDNENTEYGKKYKFSEIKTIKDYQKNVPIVTYEDLKPYVERMANGEKNILTSYFYNHFNETSATSGPAKMIPMTEKQSQIYIKYNNATIYGLLHKYGDSKWKYGRALSTSEGCYRKLPSGLSVGAASSKMAEFIKGGAEELNNMLGIIYTSPVEATNSNNGADRIYLETRFAMMDKEMTGVVTGFMSQIVHIFNYIGKNYRLIIDDIRNGTISHDVMMPDDVRATVEKRLYPMPERADELDEIFKDGPDCKFVTKIWPNLCYISGAGGANFSIYDDYLNEKFLDRKVDRIYSGITSSEGLWSFPVGLNNKSSMLATGSAFMEFLPVEAGDDFSKVKTIEEIEVGKTYELIITNVNGFYRYRMSDAVTVTGFYNKTPMVEFAYRVNNTLSLTGEKTTEVALKKAVDGMMQEIGKKYFDFCVYPDALHAAPRYIFLIEGYDEMPEYSDEELSKLITKYLYLENIEYEYLVSVARLDPPIAYVLQPQTFNLRRDISILNGAAASQLKPIKIIKDEQVKNFFMVLRRDENLK